MARALHNSSQLINAILQGSSSSSVQPMFDSIRSFKSLTDAINSQTVNIRTQIMQSFDFDKSTFWGYFVVILTAAVAFSLIIIYSVFWSINVFYKTVNLLTHLSKILMICTLVVGCLASLIALITVTVSAVIFNGCDLFDKGLEDPTSMKSFQLGGQIDKMIDVCLYSNSTGDIISILDSTNSQAFTDVKKLIGGFMNSSRLSTLDAMTNDRLSINGFALTVNGTYVPYKETAPYVDPAADLTVCAKTASDLISAKYTSNVLGLLETSGDCKLKTQYVTDVTSAGSNTALRSVDACVVLTKYSLTDYGLRYDVLETDKLITLNNTKQAELSYTNFITLLNSKLKPAADQSSDLRNLLSRGYQATMPIRNALNETRFFIEASPINSQFNTLFNCKIMRQEFLLLRYAICGDFTDRFAGQSFWLSIIGPMMALLGISMCCQLRMVERDKNKLPAHMIKDSKPTVDMNELLL